MPYQVQPGEEGCDQATILGDGVNPGQSMGIRVSVFHCTVELYFAVVVTCKLTKFILIFMLCMYLSELDVDVLASPVIYFPCHLLLLFRSHTEAHDPVRRTVEPGERRRTRQNSFKYMMPNQQGVKFTVCKEMFLHTLGYTTNANLVRRMRKGRESRQALAPVPKRSGGTTFQFNRDVSALRHPLPFL